MVSHNDYTQKNDFVIHLTSFKPRKSKIRLPKNSVGSRLKRSVDATSNSNSLSSDSYPNAFVALLSPKKLSLGILGWPTSTQSITTPNFMFLLIFLMFLVLGFTFNVETGFSVFSCYILRTHSHCAKCFPRSLKYPQKLSTLCFLHNESIVKV